MTPDADSTHDDLAAKQYGRWPSPRQRAVCRSRGGTVIAQDPAEAEFSGMPAGSIVRGEEDLF